MQDQEILIGIWKNIEINKRNYYCLKRAFGKSYKEANIEEKIAFFESISDIDIKPWNIALLFFFCTAMCAQDTVNGKTYVPNYLSEIYNAAYATESSKKKVRMLLSSSKRDMSALLKKLTEIIKRGIKSEGRTFQLTSLYEDITNWSEKVQNNWITKILKCKEEN